MADIRQPIEQLFVNFPLLVNTVPTPLNPSQDINSYVQSFFVCNPSTNANSVFWGDGGVSLISGIEILIGTTQQFVINQERQLYEIQDSIDGILAFLASQNPNCQIQSNIMKVPVIVWNPANIFLTTSVATTVAVCIMRNVYI
jgi:hypothetical protein